MILPNNGLKVLASWKVGDDSLIVAARLELTADASESSRAELRPDEIIRAESFASERDRRRYAVARAGLRRILGAHLDVATTSVNLACLPDGKPILAGPLATSGLRFNLSHTGDTVVYALAWNREIGIDVEQARTLPNAADIAARFFSAGELSELEAFPADECSLAFFRAWTRKEAFAKALGTGLTASLNDLDVSFLSTASGRFIRVRHPNAEHSDWQVHEFRLAGDLIGACVMSAGESDAGTPRFEPRRRGAMALCS